MSPSRTSRVEKRKAAREYTCSFERATEIANSETDAIVARILDNLRRIVALNEAEEAARMNSGDSTEQDGKVGERDTVVHNHQSGDINDQDQDATNPQTSKPGSSCVDGIMEAVGDTTQQDEGDDEQKVSEAL